MTSGLASYPHEWATAPSPCPMPVHSPFLTTSLPYPFPSAGLDVESAISELDLNRPAEFRLHHYPPAAAAAVPPSSSSSSGARQQLNRYQLQRPSVSVPSEPSRQTRSKPAVAEHPTLPAAPERNHHSHYYNHNHYNHHSQDLLLLALDDLIQHIREVRHQYRLSIKRTIIHDPDTFHAFAHAIRDQSSQVAAGLDAYAAVIASTTTRVSPFAYPPGRSRQASLVSSHARRRRDSEVFDSPTPVTPTHRHRHRHRHRRRNGTNELVQAEPRRGSNHAVVAAPSVLVNTRSSSNSNSNSTSSNSNVHSNGTDNDNEWDSCSRHFSTSTTDHLFSSSPPIWCPSPDPARDRSSQRRIRHNGGDDRQADANSSVIANVISGVGVNSGAGVNAGVNFNVNVPPLARTDSEFVKTSLLDLKRDLAINLNRLDHFIATMDRHLE